MEEKVYYRYSDEQEYLGESRVLITILSRANFRNVEGKATGKRARCSIQEAKGTEEDGNQNLWIISGRDSGGRADQSPDWRVQGRQ